LKTEVFAYAGKTDHPFRLILSQTEAVQALSMRAGIVVCRRIAVDLRPLSAIATHRRSMFGAPKSLDLLRACRERPDGLCSDDRWTSVRGKKRKLRSSDVPIARSIGAQKLGQPVSLSNFLVEETAVDRTRHIDRCPVVVRY
jgi:hypothetical protein